MRIKHHGFTLIELIAVIVILGIISAITARFLFEALESYITHKNVSAADWQASIALERMGRTIQNIQSSTSITTATAGSLVFTDNTGASITYQLSGTSLMENSQILADGIQSLAFTYYNASGTTTATLSLIRYINVNLTVTLNNTSFTINSTFFPRNTA